MFTLFRKRKLNKQLERFGVRVVIGMAVIAVFLFGLYYLINARNFQLFGGLTSRVDTNEKVVALTFDDGPSDATAEILSIMREHDAKGTFYLIGMNIAMYPEQTRALVEAGMELGNHTYSHPRMIGKSQVVIDSEIQSTNSLIRAAGYQGPITFRPPFGKKLFGLPWYLRQNNIKTIMWDVEPDTYAEVNPDDQQRAAMLTEYTLANVHPGSIVLFHPFWGYGTADRLALGQIIDGLKAQGYRLVTVSELLEMEN